MLKRVSSGKDFGLNYWWILVFCSFYWDTVRKSKRKSFEDDWLTAFESKRQNIIKRFGCIKKNTFEIIFNGKLIRSKHIP